MRPTYLTTGELAKRCQVSTATIHRWIKQGLIPEPINPDGKFRWNENVLDVIFGGAYCEKPTV